MHQTHTRTSKNYRLFYSPTIYNYVYSYQATIQIKSDFCTFSFSDQYEQSLLAYQQCVLYNYCIIFFCLSSIKSRSSLVIFFLVKFHYQLISFLNPITDDKMEIIFSGGISVKSQEKCDFLSSAAFKFDFQ